MSNLQKYLLSLGVVGFCSLMAIQKARALTGPEAIEIDGGPLGPLELSGGFDGLLYGITGTQKYADGTGLNAPSTNNAGTKSIGVQAQNILIELQKAKGELQWTIEVGATNFNFLGTASSVPSIQSFSTGPLYAGYVTVAPTNLPFTVSAGMMTGLEGYEWMQDYDNSNIFFTQIAYTESTQATGINFHYTKGPIDAQVFFSDGYNTKVFNHLQALVAYTINPSNSISIYYGGNLGRTGLYANTYAYGTQAYSNSRVGFGPEYANSQIFGAYYSYSSGNISIAPEVQFQYAKPQTSLGIKKSMSNIGVAVFGNYKFGTSPYSLGAWVEYFDQHEGSIDAHNGLFWYYGPNASGEGISITPTWQHKNLFARADMGALYLNNVSAYGLPEYGYGSQHSSHFNFSGLLEVGLLF